MMALRFLLDEDTKAEIATHLSKSGHDVERVVETDQLGLGSSHSDVMEYAHATNRIIITHDDDYVDPSLRTEHRGVFYCPNQRLSPFDIYRIIVSVIDTYPDQSEFPPVVYLTEDWL
jgi:predicted nuclease of predicted toxin-antitoxin system